MRGLSSENHLALGLETGPWVPYLNAASTKIGGAGGSFFGSTETLVSSGVGHVRHHLSNQG